MAKKFDLVAIGRPYTDFIVDVDEAFVRKFNLRKGRITEIQPSLMMELRTELTTNRYDIFPGGSPSNTAAGAASMGLRAAFLGVVCDDAAGRNFRNAFLGSVDFPTAPYQPKEGETDAISATCMVLVTPDKKGTVVHCSGVSDRLTVADMDPEIIANSKYMLMQAHFLFEPKSREAVLKAMEIADAAQCEIMISLHDHRMNPANAKEFIENYLPRVSLIGNRDEFEQLFGDGDLSRFRDSTKLRVMTDGANGSCIAGRGELLHIEPHSLGGNPNTVGAGDAYAAGLIAGLVNKFTLTRCGELASEIAANILETTGARPLRSLTKVLRQYLLGSMSPQSPRMANRYE